MRSSKLRTWEVDHLAPRVVVIPRSLRPAAIFRRDRAPADRSALTVGARSRALWLALAALMALALAKSAREPTRPREPPSILPRSFAAARAARVLSEMRR